MKRRMKGIPGRMKRDLPFLEKRLGNEDEPLNLLTES